MTSAGLAADPGLADLIRSLRATARDRVFSLTYGGCKYWVKTAGQPRLRSSVLLQRCLAVVAGLPLLRPPRMPGGALGLATEAEAIRGLETAGFPVPAVIACSGQWLVLGDAGEALEPRLNAADDAETRWMMIGRAGALLTRLHAAGHWHGGAQIRNFSWSEDAPGLLDFEDHDLPDMPLADRQARDLLLFLYSLTRYDREPGAPRLTKLATAMLATAGPETRRILRRLRQRMAWLMVLAKLVEPWGGRDVRQALAADAAISAALTAHPD